VINIFLRSACPTRATRKGVFAAVRSRDLRRNQAAALGAN